jgi:hypothetical protein
MERHRQIAEIVGNVDANLQDLDEIADELDQKGILPPDTRKKHKPPTRSWSRAAEKYPKNSKKDIEVRERNGVPASIK